MIRKTSFRRLEAGKQEKENVDNLNGVEKKESGEANNEETHIFMSIDEILLQIGFKCYHKILFAAFAVMVVADAMEVTLISFLSPCTREYWNLGSTATSFVAASSYGGNFCGALLWGRLADIHGRQPITAVSLGVTVVFGWLTALSPSFPFLLVSRFMVGVGVAGSVIPYDLCMELIPMTKRGTMAFLTAIWGVGSMFVAGIAWMCLDRLGWRWMVGLCTIPMCLLLITMRKWPESPRWLLSHGRDEEALQILAYIGRVSKVPLDDRIVLKPYCREVEGNYSYLKLFSKGVRGATGVVSVLFLLWGFAYTATILTVTSAFEDDTMEDQSSLCSFNYGDVFLSAFAEIIGGIVLLIMVDRFGRKKTQSILYFSAAFSVVLLGSGLPKTAMVVLAIITRGASNSATGGSWMSAPEQFPTYIRGSAHSFVYIWSRVGGMLGSFSWSSLNLTLLWQTILIAAAQILATVAVSYTQETSNKPLDEPLEDDKTTERSLDSSTDMQHRKSQSKVLNSDPYDIKNMLV